VLLRESRGVRDQVGSGDPDMVMLRLVRRSQKMQNWYRERQDVLYLPFHFNVELLRGKQFVWLHYS
jgi:hypothetical protein